MSEEFMEFDSKEEALQFLANKLGKKIVVAATVKEKKQEELETWRTDFIKEQKAMLKDLKQKAKKRSRKL